MNQTDKAFQAEVFRNFLIEEGCAFSQDLANNFLSEAEFYLKTIEEFIAKKKDDEIRALEQEVSRLPESRKYDFWADHYPIHWENIFEKQLRSSFVIALVAFLEDYVKTVCSEVSTIQRVNENSYDWHNKILNEASKFLKKQSGFSEPGDQEWNYLFNLYHLRNVLVHSGGSLRARNTSELRKFIAKEAGVSEEYGFIKLERVFCFKSLEAVRQAVLKIQVQQSALCQNATRLQLC